MTDWKTCITKVQPVRRDAAGGDSCLVLIYPPGPDMGRRFPLIGEEVVLGRGSDCEVQIDRDSVSRRHARVFRRNGEWMAEDLQSTNGSYVNDVPIQCSSLRDADLLKIGSAIFKFLSGAGVEAAYHEEIYKMTIIDALTGAHNKRYFLEFLEREIARGARYKRPLSLLLFDLDHFKKINDAHGHLTGDYVLKEICRRLLARIRKEELLARYGGEEFAAVLPETDRNAAIHVAEDFRRIVGSEPFEYEGDTIHLTISVGVATCTGENLEPVEFLRQADAQLYRAKGSGRNRVCA